MVTKKPTPEQWGDAARLRALAERERGIAFAMLMRALPHRASEKLKRAPQTPSRQAIALKWSNQ